MPELPEIESLRRSLLSVEGRRIDDVIIRRRDLRFAVPRGLKARLSASRIKLITRRGKYLLIKMTKAQQINVLLIHLGMSGRLLLSRKKSFVKHDHVIFLIGQDQLVFNDARRFGFIDFFAASELSQHPRLAHLGPEPLSSSFTPKILARRLATRQTIKAALLNQKIIAGLGNIYACEALHAAQLAPDRLANTLSEAECRRLHQAINSQIKRAIKAGGATLRDYLNAQGRPGGFQLKFHVYAREGHACLICGNIIQRITQAARATFFCPSCQTRPKRAI